MNFCATPPLIWDFSQKPLAVERLCVKNEKSFKMRYFLLIRHEIVIFWKSGRNSAQKTVISKFTYPFRVHSVFKRNCRFFEIDLPLLEHGRENSTNWMPINRSYTRLASQFFRSPDSLSKVSMERQTRLESSKSSLAKSVFLLPLPNVSPPVPFYSQSVRICFAWLRRF